MSGKDADDMSPTEVLGAIASYTYDHDWAMLQVIPGEMQELANQVKSLAEQMADRIHHVNDVLNDLHLQWQGESAEEQKEISDRWVKVFEELFGTKDKPEHGVLNAVCTGVNKAAGNFAQAEHSVLEMFTKYHESLSGKEALAGQITHSIVGALGMPLDDPVHDQTDTDHTAVTADYPDDKND